MTTAEVVLRPCDRLLTQRVAAVGAGQVERMAVCEVCENDYRLSFEVHAAGAVHVFDSFECAIHLLAPVCERCGVRVVGHGVEADGVFYCSAHCGRAAGQPSAAALVDAAGDAPVLDRD